MVHSVSGCTRGVHVKLRSLENACHTWAPYRCDHNKALYKSTFTLPLRARSQLWWENSVFGFRLPRHSKTQRK